MVKGNPCGGSREWIFTCPVVPRKGKTIAPVFGLHGALDPVLSLDLAKETKSALENAGGTVTLRVYPNVPTSEGGRQLSAARLVTVPRSETCGRFIVALSPKGAQAARVGRENTKFIFAFRRAWHR